MKNILVYATFLFTLLSGAYSNTFPVVGSTHKDFSKLLYLHYENSDGEKGLTTFQRDAAGHHDLAIWELLDGSRNSLNRHIYDENGRLGSIDRRFSDEMTSTETYTYRNDNKLEKMEFERSDGVKGYAEFVYEGDRCVQVVCNRHKGWLTAEIDFQCNDHGQVISGNVKREGKSLGTIIFQYREDGLLEKEYWNLGGGWSQTFTYEYDPVDIPQPCVYASGNPFITGAQYFRITKETYTFNNDVGGPSSYSYGELGRLINKRFERNDGFCTENKYLYNGAGFPTCALRTYSNGKSAVLHYDFNGEGRMIQRTLKRTDGVKSKELYHYRSHKYLESATFENVDTWLSGKLAFDSSEDGRISGGSFESEQQKADLIFEYDDHLNLIGLKWDFSDDTFQEYHYDYEKTGI